MIPQFPTTGPERKGTDSPDPKPAQVAPDWLRPLRGPPSHVRVDRVVRSLVWGAKGSTQAQRNGIRYEEAAQEMLAELLGERYMRNPSLRFIDGSAPRTLIPDGLLINEKIETAFVFEIKSRHTIDAWWQLRTLYDPVVSELPFIRRVVLVEVCGSFDPNVQFPEDFSRVFDLKFFVEEPWSYFGVSVWTP